VKGRDGVSGEGIQSIEREMSAGIVGSGCVGGHRHGGARKSERETRKKAIGKKVGRKKGSKSALVVSITLMGTTSNTHYTLERDTQ